MPLNKPFISDLLNLLISRLAEAEYSIRMENTSPQRLNPLILPSRTGMPAAL
jgi:hypothetical protein